MKAGDRMLMSKLISDFTKVVALATGVFISVSGAAFAQCPVSPIPVSGGGDATLDCHAELLIKFIVAHNLPFKVWVYVYFPCMYYTDIACFKCR